MRKMFFVLVLCLLASSGWAQQEGQAAVWFSAYDVPNTSYTYCVTSGQLGNPWGPATRVAIPVGTSGSSTTVAAITASSAPFATVAVGDVLYFQTDPYGAVSTRYVTAKASSDSITINSAITLSASAGYPFQYKHVACGTAATDGWIGVNQFTTKAIQLCVSTLNATSITFSVEAKIAGAPSSATLLTPAYTATGCNVYSVPEQVDQLRVGVKLAGDAGAQSVDARIEGGKQ